ncbi:MAG TPA: DinB family protein, partial [Anaerolineales bacterium]|nr:DinB family protein [Anaerolineales bacterium]
MKEAAENPVEHTARQLADRLQEQGVRTVDFFLHVQDPDWDRRVYSEGASWKIREILAHFLSSEKGVSRLVELILQGEPGVPEDFDLDAYNERKVAQLEGIAPVEILKRFEEARAATISLVRGFSDADLRKTGRHPFLGIASVEEII